jgi:hypothetical protein
MSAPAPKPCKPFSVEIAVVPPDDKREVHFGLTRGCNPDNSSFWTIDFMLKQLRGTEMKTRVEVHVAVGENKKPKAEALADSKALTPAKLSLLKNQIAELASSLSKDEAPTNPELRALLLKLL